MFNNKELGDTVNNAPEKPGIFSSHCLKHVVMCVYGNAPIFNSLLFVNKLNKEPVSASEKDLDDSATTAFTTLLEEMLKSGAFVTTAYNYATSSSMLKVLQKD